MRPSLAPWGLRSTPVRPCTPLSDVTPPDIAPSEVELSNTEPDYTESSPTSIRESRRFKAVINFKWDGKFKGESLTPDGGPEHDRAPDLNVLDMQNTRPSSVPHGRQRVTVLLKSVKIWPTGIPQQPVQSMLTEPTTQIAATEGEFIAPRHNFDTAYIEGTFDRIEYGLFRSRPAVFICIDMILKYQGKNIIKATELKFQFGKANTQPSSSSNSAHNLVPTPTSLVSNFFGPDELKGLPASSHITRHRHIKPRFAALSVHAEYGGNTKQVAETEQHRWHVQGRVDEHDGGIRDTFRWNIFENDKSDDSVPRHVRLGMIAFHEHKPFYVDVSVDGSVRDGSLMKGKRSHPTPTREKRWFNPTRCQTIGEYMLDEGRLQDHIRQKNNEIEDVVPNRVMERLRGGDQIQMMNNKMGSGGAGQDIAGNAFSLIGDIGEFSDLNTATSDVISLGDAVGSVMERY